MSKKETKIMTSDFQQVFEEMVDDLQRAIEYDEWSLKEYDNNEVDFAASAENLIKAGYRKADEVRKEVLQDIDKMAAQYDLDTFRAIIIRDLARKYGVKIDE